MAASANSRIRYVDGARLTLQLPKELTGAKVNLQTQGFFNFNQRMDLELSTGGRSFDFATCGGGHDQPL